MLRIKNKSTECRPYEWIARVRMMGTWSFGFYWRGPLMAMHKANVKSNAGLFGTEIALPCLYEGTECILRCTDVVEDVIV